MRALSRKKAVLRQVHETVQAKAPSSEIERTEGWQHTGRRQGFLQPLPVAGAHADPQLGLRVDESADAPAVSQWHRQGKFSPLENDQRGSHGLHVHKERSHSRLVVSKQHSEVVAHGQG